MPLTTASTDAFYLLERPVVTPTWKFVDGNVSWGIRRLVDPKNYPATGNKEGLMFRYSQTPAQLFETIFSTGGILPFDPDILITPPYGGQFQGTALSPDLFQFYDMRADSWSRIIETDIEFQGPCDIAFFASIQQTNPSTRENPPATPTFTTLAGAVPEDAFVQTYAGATYQRIAGSLIFEVEEWAPGGMPKTYLRTADGDRLTRDTAETGSNEIRRSGQDTVTNEACEGDPAIRVKP